MSQINIEHNENTLFSIEKKGTYSDNNSIIGSLLGFLSRGKIHIVITDKRIIVNSTNNLLFGLLSQEKQSIQYDKNKLDYVGSKSKRNLLIFKTSGILISINNTQILLQVKNKEVHDYLNQINSALAV